MKTGMSLRSICNFAYLLMFEIMDNLVSRKRIFNQYCYACPLIMIENNLKGRDSIVQKWATMLCLLVAVSLTAQSPDTLTLLQTLPVSANFATTDNLGNVYVLGTDNALQKFNAAGTRLTRYSNNRLGPATSLDATNPLKLMLWYADFRTVVFLDRSLTELGSLQLDAVGFSLVRSVAMSFDGNLWAYDEALFKLKKITPEGALLFETPALNQMVPIPPTADVLREIGNQVYLADPRQGIFVFDQYALWIETWNYPNTRDFYTVEGRQYYVTDQGVLIRTTRPFGEIRLPLPTGTDSKSHFRLAEQRLLIWDEHQVQVFRVP